MKAVKKALLYLTLALVTFFVCFPLVWPYRHR